MKINVIGGEMDRHEIEEYIRYAAKKYAGRQIGQDIARYFGISKFIVSQIYP
mgnify:CR=1 FL=1